MATIWKGAINFGLINVPVKLLSAVAKERITFRTLHKDCKTPINQKRWCSECGKEVEYQDTVKGYEYEKGSFVEITENDLKSIPVKSTKYIQIIDFINLNEIDPIYYEKAYYLAPETAGEKPYLILYRAMTETNTVAVSKITIRDKEHLCIVRVYGDILMLNTMYFSGEIKPTAEIDIAKIEKKTEVSALEMNMAKEIVKNLTAPFDADNYKDEYYNALMSLVKAKIDGKEISKPTAEKQTDLKTTDLFEKLKASVEATKKKVSAGNDSGLNRPQNAKKEPKNKTRATASKTKTSALKNIVKKAPAVKKTEKTKPIQQKKQSSAYLQ